MSLSNKIKLLGCQNSKIPELTETKIDTRE